MKQFTYQQVIAVKECGHVLCGECFKKFVGSSKQCYVCQHPVLKKKDFLQLESGGTGFSSHNKVDVKVYKPNENYVCLLQSARGEKHKPITKSHANAVYLLSF